MIWAATFIVIVLLFIFPKQIGTILAVLLAGIGAVALIYYITLYYREKEQESVSVVVSYVPDSCGTDSPLFFKVMNKSKKIVNKVSWNVIATERGSSSNIIDYKSFPKYKNKYSTNYHNEHTTPYETNKLLKPGEFSSACYKVPFIKGNLSPKNLVWKVSNKYSEFQ